MTYTRSDAQLGYTNLVEYSRKLVKTYRARGMLLRDIKIPGHYKELLLDELTYLNGKPGPLCRTVLFDDSSLGQEVTTRSKTDYFVEDCDLIIRKYPKRVLITPTFECSGHCRYCCRPAQKRRQNRTDRAAITKIIGYLEADPSIEEVIFSGGDPLTLSLSTLNELLAAIRHIAHIHYLRLHTRVPVYDPETVADEILDLIAANRVKMVLHIVHPYEFCNEFAKFLVKARSRGIPLYNQFPLLKGINDHYEVIRELNDSCIDRGIQPLSCYLPDQTWNGEEYRISLQRALSIFDRLFLDDPSWLSHLRLVVDTPIGKVRREDVYEDPTNSQNYLLRRAEKTFVYRDVDSALDSPGEPAKLLYRNNSIQPVRQNTIKPVQPGLFEKSKPNAGAKS